MMKTTMLLETEDRPVVAGVSPVLGDGQERQCHKGEHRVAESGPDRTHRPRLSCSRNEDESHHVTENKGLVYRETSVSPVFGYGQDGRPRAKIRQFLRFWARMGTRRPASAAKMKMKATMSLKTKDRLRKNPHVIQNKASTCRGTGVPARVGARPRDGRVSTDWGRPWRSGPGA